jgi:hypothetical protein
MEAVCQSEILHIKDVVDVGVRVEFHAFSQTERSVNTHVDIEEPIAPASDIAGCIHNKAAAQVIHFRLSTSARI